VALYWTRSWSVQSDGEKRDSNVKGVLTALQESHLQLDHAVEVIGQVKPDLSVKILLATDFGTNFGK
jgi:replication factor A3